QNDTNRELRFPAGAMRALNAKGIVHRDLKPQNILLCHAPRPKPAPADITLKIADFGFARFLHDGVMAATLCGSPMYMAPEVIMSLQYDAKADLWSIGTIVFQCLTGNAPFRAQTPQALKQYYEKTTNLAPRIPSGTSPELHDLLVNLLKKNARERMDFDAFFLHPFLKRVAKLSSPMPVPSRRSASPEACGPAHSATPPACGGSPLSGHLPPSPQGWCGEEPALASSPTQMASSPVAKSPASSTSTPEEQDFVMVPASLSAEEGQGAASGVLVSSSYRTEPIPVPSQKQAYEQMQRSLGRARSCGSSSDYVGSNSSDLGRRTPDFANMSPPNGELSCLSLAGLATLASAGGNANQVLSPILGSPVGLRGLDNFNGGTGAAPQFSVRAMTLPEMARDPCAAGSYSPTSGTAMLPFGSGDWGLHQRMSGGSGSPGPNVGQCCFPFGTSPPQGDPPNFEAPPELPEETLLDREHNETLAKLHFIEALVSCILELARTTSEPLTAALSESMLWRQVVATVSEVESNRIPLVSQWCLSAEEQVARVLGESRLGRTEQLVLYLRAAELLGSALAMARREVQARRLHTSSQVRALTRWMRDILCTCVSQARRLQATGAVAPREREHRDFVTNKLLYAYAMDLVSSALVVQCFIRYQTAQILLHSLAQQMENDAERSFIDKHKEAVEKRLSLLQNNGLVYAYDST
ncbi:unnamed protein product, partial [Ixodes hexagonus]